MRVDLCWSLAGGFVERSSEKMLTTPANPLVGGYLKGYDATRYDSSDTVRCWTCSGRRFLIKTSHENHYPFLPEVYYFELSKQNRSGDNYSGPLTCAFHTGYGAPGAQTLDAAGLRRTQRCRAGDVHKGTEPLSAEALRPGHYRFHRFSQNLSEQYYYGFNLTLAGSRIHAGRKAARCRAGRQTSARNQGHAVRRHLPKRARGRA